MPNAAAVFVYPYHHLLALARRHCTFAAMPYAITLTRISENMQLYLPDPAQLKPEYERQLAANPGTPFPFWAKTWPSALELAAFLREEPKWIEGKNVLELGAGTGVPSFAISDLANTITITDHAPGAVDLVNKNIQLLQLQNARALLLDWNQFPGDLSADALLLSDVNYEAGQFGPLLAIINRFLSQGAAIILSTPQRINITPFAESLEPFIKLSELRLHHQENGSVEIRILVLSK